MNRTTKMIIAAAIGAAALSAGAAMAQADASASLRATGKVGEQPDGYLGIVGSADAALRAKVDAVNIKRRAYYTDLAAKRGAKIEEVAAAAGCQILASKVQPGQFFKAAGSWQKREGGEPVPRPAYCG